VLYLSNYYQIYFVSKLMKFEPVQEYGVYVVFVLVSFVIVYFGGKYLLKAGRAVKDRLIVTETAE